MKNLPISGDEFSIDRISLDYSEEFMRLMEKPEVQRFIPDRFDDENELKECMEWLISNYSKPMDELVRLSLMIKARDSEELLGWVSYGPLPSNEELREIAYVIDPQHWGKGYGTKAAAMFLAWLEENLEKQDIYAEVDAENFSSIKVLEHNSFERLGRFIADGGGDKYLYKRKR